ncbi:MAG TPA: response regulator transcription factor [Acidimicrobiales bacterium]|nr:response regulator transcription factor [Acidimicrobiales bacterium]
MTAVVVVEDHPIYRQGLAQLLEETPDLEAVAVCRSLAELDRACLAHGVVVLLDLHLPGEDVGAAIPAFVRAGCLVLILSASVERQDVVDAIQAGARGYLDKGAGSPVIVEAIRTVAGGGSYISATLASFLLNIPGTQLTPREREVLRLVAEGASDKAIARELGITINTVHAHLDRIREKTGRRRRADLTRLAFEEKIFPR